MIVYPNAKLNLGLFVTGVAPMAITYWRPPFSLYRYATRWSSSSLMPLKTNSSSRVE